MRGQHSAPNRWGSRGISVNTETVADNLITFIDHTQRRRLMLTS